VQAAVERKVSALEELLTLPVHFTRLRPRGDAFARWAERMAASQLDAPASRRD
jgi:hypothetical protein